MALTVLIVLPLVGAIGVLVLRGQARFEGARRLGLAVSLWTLVATLALWASWDWSSSGVQFVERMPWVASFGVSYAVGLQGSGLALATLVTWIGAVALAAAWRVGRRAPAGIAAAMLVLQSAAVTSIVAQDLLLFFVGTEVMLLSTFALIGAWGRDRRVHVATKFLLCQLTGSSLMLVAIVWVAWRHQIATGAWSFAIDDLVALDLPLAVQRWIWLAFAAAYAMRLPIVPLHTWLADALAQAPVPAAMLIGGVVLPVGGFGLLRVAVPLLPEATAASAFWVAGAAAVGVLYGAVVALAQTDLRRLVACIAISHMGIVVLGACAMTQAGREGAHLQLLAGGLWLGAWLLTAGMLAERRGTTLIAEFGGLWRVTPRLSGVVVMVAVASMALPGTAGFIGVSRSLEGVLAGASLPHGRVLAGIALSGVAVWAAAMAWVAHRLVGGAVTRDRNRGLRDITPGEWLMVAPLVVALMALGIWSDPLLTLIVPAVADGLTTVAQAPAVPVP